MRPIRLSVIGGVIILVSLLLGAGLYDDPPRSKTFLDRNGEVIGTLNPAFQGIQSWVPLEEIPPLFIDKMLQAEDRFFYWHRGINPFSIVKAAVENIHRGRVVRGGSTITQQLAKLLIQEKDGASPRTVGRKIKEAILAVALEIKHSKGWILERYLNQVYFGNRCYGLGAATDLYFSKRPAALTDKEISFLVSLPKAPERLAPRLPAARTLRKGIGRHFMEFVARRTTGGPSSERVETTLDLSLQERVEQAVRFTLSERLAEDPLQNAAVVVIDVPSGEILAMVGSRDYFDGTIDGQFNAAEALRQPGSALKPFTYFAAFAKGYGPDSIVPDEPISFSAPLEETESYAPQNFDRRFHGRVTMREALANSYNVPAVVTLNAIGLSFYHETLRRFGFTTFSHPPPYYGLSITLGSGEVTPLELANAYAALARGGVYLPYRFVQKSVDRVARGKVSGGVRLRSRQNLSEVTGPGRPIVTNAAEYAAMVTSILADPNARLKAFGFNENMTIEGHEVAVKTGTSYAHRDNWMVGYSPSYAVAVWVGHDDASPLGGTTGATGAAPIWHAVMEGILRGRPPERFPEWKLGEKVAGQGGVELPRKEEGNGRSWEERIWRIASPLPNATFRSHPFLPEQHDGILAKAEVDPRRGEKEFSLSWFLDGRLLGVTPSSNPRVWIQPRVGRHDLKVISSWGESEEISFRVIENL